MLTQNISAGERLATLAERDRLIFELLLGTGIRLGSLVALNRGDVDLDDATLHIHAKGGGRERVFLNPNLVAMLARHLEHIATQGNTGRDVPVFRTKSGRRLGARQIQSFNPCASFQVLQSFVGDRGVLQIQST